MARKFIVIFFFILSAVTIHPSMANPVLHRPPDSRIGLNDILPISHSRPDLWDKILIGSLLLLTFCLVYAVVNWQIRARKQRGLARLKKFNEEHYRQLIESNNDHLFFKESFDGSLSYLSSSVERFTGIPVSEATGRNWRELFNISEELEKIIVEINHPLMDGKKESVSFEGTYRHPDGSIRIVNVYERAVRDVNGNTIGIEGIIRDITEQKNYERVLQKAKEKAEADYQSKSAFLAHMNHELRTPLNAILGFSRLLGHSPNLSSEEKTHLAAIHRSGEHLLNLINDVLSMSKIEAGRTTLNREAFDLHRLLSDIENMFQLRGKEKNLKITFSRSSDVPRYVTADEIKLRQVLINLLNNAVKFTSRGEIQLFLNRKTVPTKGSEIRLQFKVTDTGFGIAAEELNRLFEPFVQTESGRRSQEGTGLGLSISREFVRLMGGDIIVCSERGQGTTFMFDIQVEPADAYQIQKICFSRNVVGVKSGKQRYRVLIADDETDNRRLLIEILEPLGFELHEAKNGRQAVVLWKKWKPHLIWMDMGMPEMDGYEAAKEIKLNDINGKTVVIAMLAGTLNGDASKALAAGCDDFLEKPFQESDLFNLMEQHLGEIFEYREEYQCKLPDEFDIKTEQVSPALNQEALTRLPADLLTKLRQSALEGDTDTISPLIEKVRSHENELADALAALVDEFEFDKILDRLNELPFRNITHG